MNTTIVKSQEIGIVGKIIIPKEVETMIDFLHKSVGAIEWSGILFYKLNKGNLAELNNLEFRTEFLYPMNIGSHAYTEFDYSGEVMNAYDLREDLIECSTGMLHTHHSMAAFFSGTDSDELLANCKHFNYYISLIVNFSKEYKCKIAFPSKTKTVNSFTIKGENGELIVASKSGEEDNIIIGELAVEFENVLEVPEWLSIRTQELKVKKAKVVATPVKTYSTTPYTPKSYNDYDFPSTVVKKFPSGKQFLVGLMNLDATYADDDISSTLVAIEMHDLDLAEYDLAISNNIEIVHDELYRSDALFKYHCQQAMKELEANQALFPNMEVYTILKENLELYA